MCFFSVSAITIFYKKLETREMEMMLRASKNIARLMARYSGERVEGKCDFTEKKVGEIDFDLCETICNDKIQRTEKLAYES